MLLYSHIWDGLLKLITLLIFLGLAMWAKFDQRLGSGLVMVIVVAIVWMFAYRQYLSILSAWLYARLSLHTHVSFREASSLRRLFQLDVSGKWIPVKDIKKLPFEARHTALMQTLQNPALTRKAMLL